MDTLRVSRLTERQRLCLRLVHAHMSPKEIAPHLGVEPGTVDQYIKAAMAVLGVGERRTAARMLTEYEAARSSGEAGMARDTALNARAQLDWMMEILAAVAHGFRNVLKFSGRDTRRQFLSYAAFLLILNCTISHFILLPVMTRALAVMQQFIAEHPGQSSAHRLQGPHSLFLFDLKSVALALCLVALIHFGLIAAAIARRLHDRNRIELWAHALLPLAGLTFLLEPMVVTQLISIQWALCVTYALVRGGTPERIGAAMIVVGGTIMGIIVNVPSANYHSGLSLLGLDFLSFSGFALLALRANRFWPIWMTAFQGFGAVAHLATLLNPQVTQWAYLISVLILSAPSILLLLGGTYAHRVRLARNGVDPAWTPHFALFRKSPDLLGREAAPAALPSPGAV